MNLLVLAGLLGVALADDMGTSAFGHHGGSGGYPSHGTGIHGGTPIHSGGGYGPHSGRGIHGVGVGGYGNTHGRIGGITHGGRGIHGGATHGIGINGVRGGIGGIHGRRNQGCPNPYAAGYRANVCGYGRYCVPNGYGRTCCPAPTCALQGFRVKQNSLPIEVLNYLTQDSRTGGGTSTGRLVADRMTDMTDSSVDNDVIKGVFKGTIGSSLYPDDCCNICYRDHSCRGVSYLFITDDMHKTTAVCLYLRGYATGYSHTPDVYYLKHDFNQNNAGIKFSCLTAEKVVTAVVHQNPYGLHANTHTGINGAGYGTHGGLGGIHGGTGVYGLQPGYGKK